MKRAWLAGAWLALGAACSPAVPSASPTVPPVETAPPARVTPPSTPAGTLVVWSEREQSALGEALFPWAEGRGLTVSNADRNLSAVPPSAVAVIGFEGEGFPPPEAGQWPYLVLDAEATVAGPGTFVVGVTDDSRLEAGFAAGLLVGLAGGSGWVALVDSPGRDGAAYARGFLLGIRYACSWCRLLTWTPGELTPDLLRANAVSAALVLPGAEAAAAWAKMAEVDLWIVWLEARPEGVPAGELAGGVEFDSTPPVLQALEAILAGGEPQAWRYSMADGGIRLVDLNELAISPGRQRVLEEALQGLASGQLILGEGD